MTETEYATALRKLCIAEGHKPRLPESPDYRKLHCTQERAARAIGARSIIKAMWQEGHKNTDIAARVQLSIKNVQAQVRMLKKEQEA